MIIVVVNVQWEACEKADNTVFALRNQIGSWNWSQISKHPKSTASDSFFSKAKSPQDTATYKTVLTVGGSIV